METGLLKLWRTTGKHAYLLLTQKLLDLHGDSTTHSLYLNYDNGKNPYFFQDYTPIQSFDEAHGHGVRALYLYAAMTDISAYTSGEKHETTLKKLWENITNYKMYITGGIGSRHKGEAFGENYELPNAEAYNETCSSIADMLWNYKMFRNSGEGKYMDVCERILYNAFLAGWGLNGCEYNYVNPLESDGHFAFNHGSTKRQPWSETSCCPTNITRFIPQISQMVYSVKQNSLYVNLFIPSSSTLFLENNEIAIIAQGNYPWEENLAFTLTPQKEGEFALHIRIPSWTTNAPLPGSTLYQYTQPAKEKVTVKVNGRAHSG